MPPRPLSSPVFFCYCILALSPLPYTHLWYCILPIFALFSSLLHFFVALHSPPFFFSLILLCGIAFSSLLLQPFFSLSTSYFWLVSLSLPYAFGVLFPSLAFTLFVCHFLSLFLSALYCIWSFSSHFCICFYLTFFVRFSYVLFMYFFISPFLLTCMSFVLCVFSFSVFIFRF